MKGKGEKNKNKEKTSDVIELAFVKFSEACHQDVCKSSKILLILSFS
jgi:hypothetical protein